MLSCWAAVTLILPAHFVKHSCKLHSMPADKAGCYVWAGYKLESLLRRVQHYERHEKIKSSKEMKVWKDRQHLHAELPTPRHRYSENSCKLYNLWYTDWACRSNKIYLFQPGRAEETGSGTEESSAQAHLGCFQISMSAICCLCFRRNGTASGLANGQARWPEYRERKLSNIHPMVKQLAFLFDLSLLISLA